MSEFETARRNMIEGQLRPNRITDPDVLDAFEAVPREAFLPKRLRAVAYNDEDVDLGQGRHLIEPLALARMAQEAKVKPDDVALVIGDDTGYAAAILSRMAATVFLLMPDQDQAATAEALLDKLDLGTVVVQSGDVTAGLPGQAPFNVVLLAGSVPAPPPALSAQLDDGGRMALIAQADRHLGKITVVTRVGDAFGAVSYDEAVIPPLLPFLPKPTFVF